MERRNALKRFFGVALTVLAFFHEDVFNYLFPEKPKPNTGSLNVTLEPAVAGGLRHERILLEPMHLTWTGHDVDMRVGGAPSV